MIAKITHGDRFGGLMAYLVGPGRSDEHSDQHLIAGDPALVAMHGLDALDRSEALAIAKDLDAHRRQTGAAVTSTRRRYDSEVGDYVNGGIGHEHVWQCSLSLHPDEAPLSDEKWAQIAQDFMARMGFDDPADPREPARWVAVRHGLSEGGNDHIHLVASVVRADGTKVAGYRDYKRASNACYAIEREQGLRVVEARAGGFTANERGYTQAEDFQQREQRQAQGKTGTDRRSPDDLVRHDVHRIVRGAATAATDEAEFVRRLRQAGLGVRPRFAKGTDDVVVGYSVRVAKTAESDASRWFAGGKIARDLSLPGLRAEQGWSTTPEAAMEAAAEWRAGGRELRPTKPGRETRPPKEADWRRWYERTDDLVAQLAQHSDNPGAWASAAREASGALAAWSVRQEGPGGGPLGHASRALARSAWVARSGSESAVAGSRGSAVDLGNLAVLMTAVPGKKSRTLDAALLAQIMRLAQAVHGAHAAAGRAHEAERIKETVRGGLHEVAAALPAVRSLAEYDAGAGPRAARPAAPKPAKRPGPYKPAKGPVVDPERVAKPAVTPERRPEPTQGQDPQRGRRR